MRHIPLLSAMLLIPVGIGLMSIFPTIGAVLTGVAIITSAGTSYEFFQTRSSASDSLRIQLKVLYLLECIGRELRQYFTESDHIQHPCTPEQRALAYRCARNAEGFHPFGTPVNALYNANEWLNHSNHPIHVDNADFRIRIGGDTCEKPYESSVLNVSSMPIGALSRTAIKALNRGVRMGGFAQGTGDGLISEFHELPGGDLILQLESDCVGYRDDFGKFDPNNFAKHATKEQVKMVEIKLSQGDKPDFAAERGLPEGIDYINPASHSTIDTPVELINFIDQIRALSGGKPVGIKLSISQPSDFFSIAKAMCERNILPDFFTIDDTDCRDEDATLESVDPMDTPLREGLMLVHNTLHGLGIREKIKILIAGDLINAFDLARAFSLGADGCLMARGFIETLGTDDAATSIDSEPDEPLTNDKQHLDVAKFHANTLKELAKALSMAGLNHPSELAAHHLMLRIDNQELRSAANQYHWLEPGALLTDDQTHPTFQQFWGLSDSDSFSRAA